MYLNMIKKNDVMEDGIGTVVSTYDGPSTTDFSFVLNSNSVRKGQFVQVETEDGTLVAHVKDIIRANRYFERAEAVAEYERDGSSLIRNFPTTEWEYTIADCRALGIYKEGNIHRNVFPPSPGSDVRVADEELLKKVLGIEEDGLEIGTLHAHSNVSVRISMNRLLQKHFAILAMSGAGKSYLASVIIEELLSRKEGRPAVIVVDVHGEYKGFAESPPFSKRTNIVDGRKMRIGLRSISPDSLFAFLPKLSTAAKRVVRRALAEMREGSGEVLFDIDELMKKIDESKIKENVKEPLLLALSNLKSTNVFGRTTYPTTRVLAKPGMLSVIDLSGIDDMRRKQIIVAHFARKLFKARKEDRIPPFLLMVEESHNFAKEKVKEGEYLAKPVIETIAREGRKFGASLCLISQRPVKLSTTALSQCNTHIIMRVTNPYDIKHIGESCEGIDASMERSITTLRTGEALIVGEAINFPIFVKVRKRKSKKSDVGESIDVLARRFEEMMRKNEEDVEAFL